MIKSEFFLIQDAFIDIIEKEWDKKFLEEYGISGWELIKVHPNCEEICVYFKDQESKDNYMEEFDLPE